VRGVLSVHPGLLTFEDQVIRPSGGCNKSIQEQLAGERRFGRECGRNYTADRGGRIVAWLGIAEDVLNNLEYSFEEQFVEAF
jgi:hypothetical protein